MNRLDKWTAQLHDHTQTHHTRYESAGQMNSPTSRSHSDTPHSIWIGWTSEQPNFTITPRHTTLRMNLLDQWSAQLHHHTQTHHTRYESAGPVISSTSRSHSNTPHSVWISWASDQPNAESSTWQNTTSTIDRLPWIHRGSNQQSQQASGRRPTP
jgi:hypothetical protein